ncbi:MULTISPECIES: sensor histidine kinase [Methylosinus]|uniref:histidine kinase n=1 Tax=Methylosinus trichosporium (strain ATCC 35070 / NCIMB 11131 / UNIQEM 75 / OB3b) TaxID=595536 RepID=A0A2D2D363_METT3|nr:MULTISPECIES: ATP-binding protein [Methylosinus]ATQ69396.1 PAS domain-containing sensor histidine kinase [Methylosinus trichosporium OB3b]OBS52908.1 PAS domain-containing sensor histidine kinase [Methylosinus sp. 3S-1]
MSIDTVGFDHFREMIEASPAAIIMAGADGAMRYANMETERMFGYARAELIGRPVELLVPARLRRRHAHMRRLYCADPSRLLMGRGPEIQARRRDGSEFPVEIGLAPAQTAAGLVVMATVLDMSERRAVERELAGSVAELEHANEQLAQFAYVASLDLHQPLAEIVGQSQRLDAAMAAGDCAAVMEASRRMRHCALGARRLVEDLLIYARTIYGDQRLEIVELGEEVRRALDEIAPSLASGETRLGVDLPEAAFIADRAQFARLIQNIVANAVKYRKPGEAARVAIIGAVDASAMLTLEIADWGVGFDPEFTQRIFEPFSRPAGVEYAGAGIELAICKSIADRHGWRISVESKPGQGAAFRFSIPTLIAIPSARET